MVVEVLKEMLPVDGCGGIKGNVTCRWLWRYLDVANSRLQMWQE